MKHWLRDNVRWVAPIAAIAAVFAGWLIFGYFGFQTLLFDDEVNEDVPVFASGAAPSGIPSDGSVAGFPPRSPRSFSPARRCLSSNPSSVAFVAATSAAFPMSS